MGAPGEREEERRAEAEAEALDAEDELGAGEEPRCSFPPPRSWHRQARIMGRATFSFVLSFVFFLGAHLLFLGTGLGRRAYGSLQRAAMRGLRDRKRTLHSYVFSP